MQAVVELPEGVVRELESLARNEGATTAELIQRIVEGYLESRQKMGTSFRVVLPLIPASETGRIQPVSGMDVDQLLSSDHFPA